MLSLLLVEDNANLRPALQTGLNATGVVRVDRTCETGEAALAACLEERPDAVIMDIQLAGELNGIEAAEAIRREYPRLPVVFYSIQDDDAYFRAFRKAGILTHFAYVRKSNYLLPELLLPVIRDAVSGRGFIDPAIETRVQEVRALDEQDPLALLEPNEREVARMLAAGLTNEQIAARMGFKDKRTISRVNGQIYTVWGLNETATDEKVARTRAALIVSLGRMLRWDEDGGMFTPDGRGGWAAFNPSPPSGSGASPVPGANL
jgi:DNA-binding NarL/FixJ family response regulator